MVFGKETCMFNWFKKKTSPTDATVPVSVVNILNGLPEMKGFLFETQYADIVAYTNNWYKNIRNYLQIQKENGKINHREMETVLKFFSRILPKD